MCVLVIVQVWQSSEDALLQMLVVILVRLAAEKSTVPDWENLGTGGQLLLVSEYQFSIIFPPVTVYILLFVCLLCSSLNPKLTSTHSYGTDMYLVFLICLTQLCNILIKPHISLCITQVLPELVTTPNSHSFNLGGPLD